MMAKKATTLKFMKVFWGPRRVAVIFIALSLYRMKSCAYSSKITLFYYIVKLYTFYARFNFNYSKLIT